MKVFFFYIGTPTPIFETELELIRKHEKSGDTVRVLQCTGNLVNCHWNQNHNGILCATCRSKFENGWHILNPGKNIDLREFPADKSAPNDIQWNFNSLDEIMCFRYDKEQFGTGVASSLVSIFRDHRFDTRKFHVQVTSSITSAVQVYKTLKQEFEDFRPDRVYIFNGRITTHMPAMLLSNRMDIEYFTYEVAGTSNCYLLRKNSTSHSISAFCEEMDMLWSAGEADREKIAQSFFIKKRMGINCETMPSFTKYQAKGFLPKGFKRNKKNISIFNSTLDEYVAVAGWKNLLYEPDETAGISKILEAFESDDRYFFYLRVHPHLKEVSNNISQLRDIRELSHRFANLCVIWPSDIVDSYALMDACEKIVTFGSTIGVEAAYWGKPSILAGRAFYEHLDCVYVPKTHEEVVNLLKKDLAPLPAASALKYGFREMSHGIPYEYFKQTGFKNGLAIGTFDGVVIKPTLLYRVLFFLYKVRRFFMKPSKILRSLNNYAKTAH